MSEWLDNVSLDNTAMGEVKKTIAEWRRLRGEVIKAEAALAMAQHLYDEYVKATAVPILKANGIEEMKLSDGTQIVVAQQTKCGVKKDEASRKQVAEWLEKVGAGDLVKSQLIVMESNEDTLRKLGVPYDKEVSMNTNSIKAFVLGEMRVNNLTAEDLPKGLSWYQWEDIKVCDAQ